MCSSISEVYDTHECYVLVKLDLPRIRELHLHVSARSARDAILGTPKLKLKETDVHLEHDHAIKVHAPRRDREESAAFELLETLSQQQEQAYDKIYQWVQASHA